MSVATRQDIGKCYWSFEKLKHLVQIETDFPLAARRIETDTGGRWVVESHGERNVGLIMGDEL